MRAEQKEDTEAVQRMVARIVASNPAGRNLALIGGFRYRFLDGSVRTSDDVDYHWSGDLGEKQAELVTLFERILLPQVRRQLGYDGSAAAKSGPDCESTVVRVVDLALWQKDVPNSRIEIPVEVTHICCADPVGVRTADGTLYATPSDADMIESKVIAVLNRVFLRHRDIVDVFLFHNHLAPDSPERLAVKLRALGITQARVDERILDLHKHVVYHAKTIQAVMDTRLDTEAAAQLNDAGGGAMVLAAALRTLDHCVVTRRDASDESN